MANQIEHYEESLAHLGSDMANLMEDLRDLNNEYQNLIGAIRVNVRIRPLQETEIREQPVPTIECHSRTEMTLTVPPDMLKSDNHTRTFGYDFEQIYDQNSSQDDLFRELSTLIQSSVDGYAVCVFAYGQTGAGKTYTMIGGEGQDRGLLPRTVDLIFDRFKALESAGIKCSIDISFVEIYNEKMKDLVEHSGREIREMVMSPIKTKEQLEEKIFLARQKRSTAKTGSNEESSRSHAIFHIRITCLHTEKRKPKTSIGSVTIVDLAGSERLKESKTVGERFLETKAINLSLSSLKDVIASLSKKEVHVPYRNSLLTEVLQPYLGKESKTLVIINVSPFASHYSQTNGSLTFGKQLRTCSNKVEKVRPQMLSLMSSGKKNPQDRLNSSFTSVNNQHGPLARAGSGMKIANRGHEAILKKSLSSSFLMESGLQDSRPQASSKPSRPMGTKPLTKPISSSLFKPTASSSLKSAILNNSKVQSIVDENSNTSNSMPAHNPSSKPLFCRRPSPEVSESLLLSPIEESPVFRAGKIVPEGEDTGSLLRGLQDNSPRDSWMSNNKLIAATPKFGE